MRGGPIFLLSILVLASGCIATPEEIESAAIEPSSAVADPGIYASPRVVVIPAGSSYTLVWLNATPEDWTDYDDEKMLLFAYETPKGAEYEALSVLFFHVDGSTLVPGGMHMSIGGGGGAGGSGRTGEPEPVTALAAISVLEAAAPFDVVIGADEWLDFEMSSTTIPGRLIDQGDFAGLGFYFEFGSPFALAFGGEASSGGFEVADGRLHPPVGETAAAAAGSLHLALEHALDGPGIHYDSLWTMAFQGARAGQWDYLLALDGEERAAGGVYAEPAPHAAIVHAEGNAAQSVSLEVTLDAVAEVFPITVVNSLTIPWDPASLGLTLEEEFAEYGGLPILHSPAGCIDLAAFAPPSRAACAQLL